MGKHCVMNQCISVILYWGSLQSIPAEEMGVSSLLKTINKQKPNLNLYNFSFISLFLMTKLTLCSPLDIWKMYTNTTI